MSIPKSFPLSAFPLHTNLIHKTSSGSALGGAAASGSDQMTSFAVSTQLQSQWCWAAISVGVANHYGTTGWTQCSVASAELGVACCSAAVPTSCNKDWWLDKALTRVTHFLSKSPSIASFSGIQTEVGARKPLGARIAWVGGNAHFIGIRGWIVDVAGVEWVEVEDSIYGNTTVTYQQLAIGYKTPGDRWTHTYFTH